MRKTGTNRTRPRRSGSHDPFVATMRPDVRLLATIPDPFVVQRRFGDMVSKFSEHYGGNDTL
jgi:hypothetical protein